VVITGKLLRILPFKDIKSGGDTAKKVVDLAKKVVDLIIADESDYQRVSDDRWCACCSEFVWRIKPNDKYGLPSNKLQLINHEISQD